MKLICAAEDVVTNDPAWKDAIFHISIPSGYLITDTSTPQTRSAIILEDGSEWELLRGERLPRVPVGRAIRPDATQPAD